MTKKIERLIVAICLSVLSDFLYAAPRGDADVHFYSCLQEQELVSVPDTSGQPPFDDRKSSLLNLIEKDSIAFTPMVESVIFEPIRLKTMEEFIETDTLLTSRFLLPMVFAGHLLPRNFSLYQPAVRPPVFDPLPISACDKWLRNAMLLDSLRRIADTKIVVHNPADIDYTIGQLPAVMRNRRLTDTHLPTLNINLNVAHEFKELKMGLPKVPFWRSTMQSSVQLSQVYISENWYQGGTSNLNVISSQNYNLKYDDLKNMQFETTILWKFGLNNAVEDTLHTIRVNEDLFQIDSKIGHKAFKHWYYTLSSKFKTQLFNNYKSNSNEKQAEFLSPGEFYLSLGMDYKYNNDKRKLSTSIILSPVSYELRFVADDKEIDPKRFGIEKGNKQHKVGSRIESTFRWEFYKRMIWSARLGYFTNYKNVQIEYENTFDLIVNRFFSTRIFLHARYDDGVKPKENGSYIQFKELLSFGFNYRF